MAGLKEISSSKCFDGYQKVFEHDSQELGCKMKFSIFLPSTVCHAEPSSVIKLPVVYYLGGFMSTERTMTQTGVQRSAEHYKLIIVGPDSRPRVNDVEGDPRSSAGLYTDATMEPWKKNFRMYSYITKELKGLVEKSFACADGGRVGIMGHSMGGNGALVCFFRNPQLYGAVSAIAPYSNPINTDWGEKYLGAYLGPDKTAWAEYDATELVQRKPRPNITIKVCQGSVDEHYDRLLPKNFVSACNKVGQPVEYTEHDGYDHSNYFISTIIESHMKHFAQYLHEKL